MTQPDQPSTNRNREKAIPRVTALDAVDLDSEIQRILKDQLLKIIHILSPSWGRWEPEMDLFLRLIVWKLSVHQLGATFGQQLLSIRYDSGLTRRRAVAWATLAIGVGYLHKRYPELTALVAPQHKDKVRESLGQMEAAAQVARMLNLLMFLREDQLHDLVDRAVGERPFAAASVREWLGGVEAAVQVARMLNLLTFLREGQFPDLVDRVVGVRPVAATSVSRIVGYSYMTRELLWHGFVELIVFLLPLVNFPSLQRSLRRCLGLGRYKTPQREPLVFTVATRCAVCHQPPTLPHQMGCGHAFCYYCLQSNRASDAKFECPSCGYSTEEPTAVQPVTSAHCRSL